MDIYIDAYKFFGLNKYRAWMDEGWWQGVEDEDVVIDMLTTAPDLSALVCLVGEDYLYAGWVSSQGIEIVRAELHEIEMFGIMDAKGRFKYCQLVLRTEIGQYMVM